MCIRDSSSSHRSSSNRSSGNRASSHAFARGFASNHAARVQQKPQAAQSFGRVALNRTQNKGGQNQQRTAQQKGRHMLGNVGKNLGSRESERIQQRTGLSAEKVQRMAERQGIGIRQPQGPGDLATEQDNLDAVNQIEGDVNNENEGAEEDWSSRFDELNSDWEDRFSQLESMFSEKLTALDETKKPEEGLKPAGTMESSSNFDAASIVNGSAGTSGTFQTNLDRLFKTSEDDDSVTHDGSTAYQGAGGSGGSRKEVDEFAAGQSPNGAYVNDPRDYYTSGTVGAKTTIDLDDDDALMHGSEVKKNFDDERAKTASGQPLAGTALNFAF